MNTPGKIAVLGSGAWGTALAVLLVRNGHHCALWGNDATQMEQLLTLRTHPAWEPAFPLPEALIVEPELNRILRDYDDILIAVPSHVFEPFLQRIAPDFTPGKRLVWATKGFVPHPTRLIHEVATSLLGKQTPLAVLSGPSFAKEVLEDLPTTVALAASENTFAEDLVQYFHQGHFRIALTEDMIGLEIGGAVKNVLAIATGMSDGLGFGTNARSALITQGLHEMTQFGIAWGAHPETFNGLAGLGDLILTCTDNQSRNRRFGMALGRGLDPKAAQDSIHQVIEGIATVASVYESAQQKGVEMPITEQIYRIIYEQQPVKQAVHPLFF